MARIKVIEEYSGKKLSNYLLWPMLKLDKLLIFSFHWSHLAVIKILKNSTFCTSNLKPSETSGFYSVLLEILMAKTEKKNISKIDFPNIL